MKLKTLVALTVDFFGLWNARLFRSLRLFDVEGRKYHYFFHSYNVTWRHERAIEVPIIRDVMKRYQGKKILEVGNVMSNYFSSGHDVVDKYDLSLGVIKQDVVDISAVGQYDLVMTVSTLEHVGWDETPKDPQKVLRALEVLRRCLKKSGQGIVTFPIGYNPPMDALFDAGKFAFREALCFKRVSSDNQWQQVQWQDIKGLAYNSPYNDANGLVIGFFDAKGSA